MTALHYNHYRDREPLTRTRIVALTPAQEAAFHEQLRLEDARAALLRTRQAEIVARMEARRYTVADIADSYARAKVRYAARKPIQLPLALDCEAA